MIVHTGSRSRTGARAASDKAGNAAGVLAISGGLDGWMPKASELQGVPRGSSQKEVKLETRLKSRWPEGPLESVVRFSWDPLESSFLELDWTLTGAA